MSIPCEWNYTDNYMCEHNSDSTCDPCEQADKYMVQVLVVAQRDAPDHIGAPWGGSWEVPPETEQGAYSLDYVHADCCPLTELTAMGFDPTETG